jgi:hypothetical protein
VDRREILLFWWWKLVGLAARRLWPDELQLDHRPYRAAAMSPFQERRFQRSFEVSCAVLRLSVTLRQVPEPGMKPDKIR